MDGTKNCSGRNHLLFVIFLLLLALAIQLAVGCGGKSNSLTNAPTTGGGGGDDDAAAADDDSFHSKITYPKGHKSLWDCYLCHAEPFLGTKAEDHGHVFKAPDECLGCHHPGTWSYTNPNAPPAHGATDLCWANCHVAHHQKTWSDTAECMTCHLPTGGSGGGPNYPKNHNSSWDCYLCHATDFYGAKGEPHQHQYNAPTQCVGCHGQSNTTYTNPNAPAGHGATQDCWSCHTAQHGQNGWTDVNECLVCHQAGVPPPTYPNNHDATWDCYICHATNLQGVSGQEPHQHKFTSPTQCVLCHQMGNWTNPGYAETMNAGQDCTVCHGKSQHGVTFQNGNQCPVCHQGGGGGGLAMPRNYSASRARALTLGRQKFNQL